MNTKNKVVKGLAGLLVASGIAGFGSGCATTPNYVKPNDDNVATHVWLDDYGSKDFKLKYTVLNEEDIGKLIREEKVDLPEVKLEDGRVLYDASKVTHGIDANGNFERRVDYDSDNKRVYPFWQEKGLVEYVKFEDGRGVGKIKSDGRVLLRFYDDNGYTTYSKEELESVNAKDVLSSENLELYKVLEK